jgi:hypothetical protein
MTPRCARCGGPIKQSFDLRRCQRCWDEVQTPLLGVSQRVGHVPRRRKRVTGKRLFKQGA